MKAKGSAGSVVKQELVDSGSGAAGTDVETAGAEVEHDLRDRLVQAVNQAAASASSAAPLQSPAETGARVDAAVGPNIEFVYSRPSSKPPLRLQKALMPRRQMSMASQCHLSRSMEA